TRVGQIGVGSDPDAVAYAAGLGEWIVADAGSGTVSIVNATDNRSVANLTVGIYPDSIALIPGRALAIVANGYSDNLSLINLTDDRVVRTLPGGAFPADVAFDTETGQIVVADALSGELQAENLSGGNLTSVSVGRSADGLAIDAATGVWVSIDSESDRLAFVPAANRTMEETLEVGSDPTQVVFDPGTGSIYVVNLGAASLMVVVPQLYRVTARQLGLPAGTPWSVTLAGGPTFETATPTMEWNATNGSYAYTVGSSYPDRVDPAPGRFSVQGTPDSLTFLFRQPFNVSVSETGSPIGSAWWLNLSDGQSFESHHAALTFEEVNGSYRYLAACSTPNRAHVSGWLNLSGAPVTLRLEFRSLYPVTVVATGIAPGTGWTLTLSNGVSVVSAGASVSLPLVNGTYGFRASAPGEGRIPVVGQFSVAGAPLALSIAFRPFLSPVTFEETGLPNGTAWTIHFENGTLLT
ncbi:surface layer protein, partial [mine drainage metagenome]